MDVAQSAPQGDHYSHATLSLASLTGNKEGSKGLMVLRVKPTPTRFPTNVLYTPVDNTSLHSLPYVCATRGAPAVVIASVRARIVVYTFLKFYHLTGQPSTVLPLSVKK